MASWSYNWWRPISSSELSWQRNVKLIPTYPGQSPADGSSANVRQPELIHVFVYGKDGPQIISWMDLMKDVELCNYAFGSFLKGSATDFSPNLPTTWGRMTRSPWCRPSTKSRVEAQERHLINAYMAAQVRPQKPRTWAWSSKDLAPNIKMSQ